MGQDHALAWDRGLLNFPSMGEPEWLAICPSGAAFCGQLGDELCPLPVPAFICKIHPARLSFISVAESRLFTL